MHAADPRQGRHHGAQARHKLGEDKPPRAAPFEGKLRAAHTGIRLERNATDQPQHGSATQAAEDIPERVTKGRGENRHGDDEREIHALPARERSGGKQYRRGRHRQTDLFSHNPGEEHRVPVAYKKLDDFVHALLPAPGLFAMKAAVGLPAQRARILTSQPLRKRP